ncbi:C-type lectin domain family 4 member F-like [Paroedura picta]|uniref:C-type lectin domain family 4 member F-like n=1 Tax=Paroedura picta TaxID=143630 RepID=UPI0040564006
MAPKGKPEAAKGGKAPAKGAKGGKGGGKKSKVPPGTLTEQQIQIYLACGVIASLSLLTIMIVTIMYGTLQEIKSPVDYPLKNLRKTVADTIEDQEMEKVGAMDLAYEVETLKIKFKEAKEDYAAKRKKYQSLFYKAMRSSSGPWKFHGKSLYYFGNEEKTWPDAENFCISRDAHLASVLNDEEQEFISSQIKQASWIGLKDENKTGGWAWTDGSKIEKQYWSHGEPRVSGHASETDNECALVLPSSAHRNWKDDECHKLYGWVCKEILD